MPIYAYRCAACGHAKDALQKLSDKEKDFGRLVVKSEQAIKNALTNVGNRLPSDLRPASLKLNDFRVAAVNEAGPGEYAETSHSIKPAPAPCLS